MSPLAAIADFVPDNCGVSGAAPADGAEGGRTGPTSTLACGWWKIAATPWARSRAGGRWHVRRPGHASRSIRPIKSPSAKGAPWLTDDEQLARIARSFRDWGRDCYCSGGENNTCGKRFSQQFGTLPYGYDHKYVYSHIGYNLKVTDIQAAIGCAQLRKLDGFVAARRRNWACSARPVRLTPIG